MSFTLGIDLGTSGCKATLLSKDGLTVSAASDAYPVFAPEGDRSEQNPSDWWVAAASATRRVMAAAGARAEDVLGIGLTGQMHSLVLLDRAGRVLRPAILWSDKRSAPQCREASRLIPELPEITGNPLIPAFTLPQLLWVRDNEPDLYRQIGHVLVPKDWLRREMTGTFVTEPSDASGTGMFDVRQRRWSTRIIRGLGVPEEWLPECMPSTAIAGALTSQAAEALGLAEGLPVVAGAGDQAAQAVAMGAIDPDVLGITIGTSGVVVATCISPRQGAFCHAIGDRWLRLNSMHAAGLSLNWYRDTFDPGRSFPELLAQAEPVSAGSEGLLFLPFLQGEREAMEPTIPAAFLGLGTRHRAGHVLRAILEGVACEIRRMVERWTREGTSIREVRFSGGGSRSPLWRGILADMLDLPVSATSAKASGGAALLAGVANGWWPSVGQAVHHLRNTVAAVPPDPQGVLRLDATFHAYLDAVDRLYPVPAPDEASLSEPTSFSSPRPRPETRDPIGNLTDGRPAGAARSVRNSSQRKFPDDPARANQDL